MKKRILFIIPLSLSFFVIASLPALSQEINTKAVTEKPSPQTTNQTTFVKAIIVKSPNDIEFDTGAKKQLLIILLTAEPVYNNVGKVLIPANSRIEAVLVPVDKGAMIVAKSLIINGKSYPIHGTIRNKIHARKVTKKNRIEQAQTYSSSVNRILSMSSSSDTDETKNKDMNINTILKQVGAVAGLLNPRSKLVSRIPQGSEYILHLQQPLRLNTTQNINQ